MVLTVCDCNCILAKGQFLTLGTLVSYCFRFSNKPVEMLLVITNIGTKCGRLKGSKCSDVVLCHPSEMLFYFMSVFLQVNSLNDDLNTPLHIACQHNIKPPIILKLVQVRLRPVFFWYNF